MKTIGTIIKTARMTKNMSISEVEKNTKIKSSFINSIENENWAALPEFPTVLGFVKSLASALSIDPAMAVAVFKRDYPPTKLSVSPKPDVTSKVVWSPKLTFIFGISAVLIILFGYLIAQYIHFISPPRLAVESPKEGQVVNGGAINVFGTTDSDAKITVNNQPVSVDKDGKFSVNLDVAIETGEILIQASSRSGKTTTVSRKITVQ